MISNVDGYMVSIQIMDQFGNIKTIYFPKVSIGGPLSVDFQVWKDDSGPKTIAVNIPASFGQTIIGGATYYTDHNKGAWGETDYAIDASDYDAVYAFWTLLNENLLRDLVQVTYDTDVETGTAVVPFVTELYALDGLVKQVGPTFDGTVFSLKDVMGVKPTIDAFIPTGYWGTWDYFNLTLRKTPPPLSADATGYTALQWMAKDQVTVPWDTGSQSASNPRPPRVIAGTGIWDASLPAPNAPTPDGNILIKKMADLQREQWIQIFFRPIYDLRSLEQTANPYMLEWQLINGEFVPVVKYIVIRPDVGGAINRRRRVARARFRLHRSRTGPDQWHLGPARRLEAIQPDPGQAAPPSRSSTSPLVLGSRWARPCSSTRPSPRTPSSSVPGFCRHCSEPDLRRHLFWSGQVSGAWSPATTPSPFYSSGTQSHGPAPGSYEIGDAHPDHAHHRTHGGLLSPIPYPVIVQSQTFTLTARDQWGNLMPGVVVALATAFGVLSAPSVTTGAAGVAPAFTLSAGTAGARPRHRLFRRVDGSCDLHLHRHAAALRRSPLSPSTPSFSER